MDREVIHDDWTGERNSDVLGVYEWKGHSFFFVHFAPPPALKNPLPPAGSVWGMAVEIQVGRGRWSEG